MEKNKLQEDLKYYQKRVKLQKWILKGIGFLIFAVCILYFAAKWFSIPFITERDLNNIKLSWFFIFPLCAVGGFFSGVFLLFNKLSLNETEAKLKKFEEKAEEVSGKPAEVDIYAEEKKEMFKDEANVVFCEGCGGIVPNGVAHCPTCNKAVVARAPRYCTQCGAALTGASEHCPKCNAPIACALHELSEPLEHALDAPIQGHVTHADLLDINTNLGTDEGTHFCDNCGNLVAASTKICPECGKEAHKDINNLGW